MHPSWKWIVVGLLATIGCDDGETTPDDFPRACDQSTVDGDCITYVGEGYTESDVGELCTVGEVVDSCPDGAIGECTLDADTVDATVSSFYPQFWTGNQAAQSCLSRGGTWTDA